MNTVEITKMSLVEKLQAMDAIWDSLIHDNLDVKSPEWHGDILSTRKKKIEEGKAEFCSIEELRARSTRRILNIFKYFLMR